MLHSKDTSVKVVKREYIVLIICTYYVQTKPTIIHPLSWKMKVFFSFFVLIANPRKKKIKSRVPLSSHFRFTSKTVQTKRWPLTNQSGGNVSHSFPPLLLGRKLAFKQSSLSKLLHSENRHPPIVKKYFFLKIGNAHLFWNLLFWLRKKNCLCNWTLKALSI